MQDKNFSQMMVMLVSFLTIKFLEGYRQLFLYLFTRFAIDLHEEYRIRGISDNKTDDTSRQAEERIFKKVSDNFSEYEENTNLQRSAKAYLMAGNKLGSCFGIKII